MEYLALWDGASTPSLFKIRISKQALAEQVKPGKNWQIFLRFVNAAGQRSVGTKVSMAELAAVTLDLLPHRITTKEGAHYPCPHFWSTDASQNACKLVIGLQTLLTAQTGGKERSARAKRRVALAASTVSKDLRRRSHRCSRRLALASA